MARTRSQQMSRIRGKNTSPELRLRRALWAAGHRYRVHFPTPAGRADIAIVKARIAIYIDGCFFHGCPEHYVRPRSRSEFWSDKLRDNVERDRRQTLALEADGWRVCRVWEHEVFETVEVIVERIERLLAGSAKQTTAWRVVRAEAIAGSTTLETWTIQDLRKPARQKVIERIRTTAKWKKPD
jgi:DNA mismatch endonuclease (patch repair protein)